MEANVIFPRSSKMLKYNYDYKWMKYKQTEIPKSTMQIQLHSPIIS